MKEIVQAAISSNSEKYDEICQNIGVVNVKILMILMLPDGLKESKEEQVASIIAALEDNLDVNELDLAYPNRSKVSKFLGSVIGTLLRGPARNSNISIGIMRELNTVKSVLIATNLVFNEGFGMFTVNGPSPILLSSDALGLLCQAIESNNN